MIYFEDVFTNDILMSSEFQFELAYDDTIMKVKSEYVPYVPKNKLSTLSESDEFDASEEVESNCFESENYLKYIQPNIQFAHGLVEISFSKTDFIVFIGNMLKKIKTYMETYMENNHQAARVEAFQRGASNFVKFAVSKFNDLQFYRGNSEDPDGTIIISYWEDDSAKGPVFYFFNDALKVQK